MAPHGCDGHIHDYEDADELGLSLRPQMDLTRVVCLNEEVANSGRSILKIHEERMTLEPTLRSPEDDPELLLTIPFTEAVSVHSISVRSIVPGGTTSPPKTIKIFSNREDMDFDMARSMTADMQLELLPPLHAVEGTIDYPLRPAGRFQGISCLTIFFVDNYSSNDPDHDDTTTGTEITFVGVKGKGSRMKREVVETVYESRGVPKDHKAHEEYKNTQLL